MGAFFSAGGWLNVLQAALILVLGLLLGRILGSAVARVLHGKLDAHGVMIARRVVFYFILGLAVASALHQLGFRLGVLLGAAGVVSVALGFASQTSVSNLISGLFLVGERPFGVGDVVRIGSTTGEVLSIDLLSVKLRTFDNLYVRIPNETLIKSEMTNMSRFPIRRADLQIGVAYKESIKRVREVLLEVAERNPVCLEEPKPVFMVLGFGDSSINLQFSVWAKRENFLELRNSMQEQIKEAFDEHGIEIPFPHLSLYAGSVTDPIPVRYVDPDPTTSDKL
ncbi:mechanosensitive ion channel protein [Alkalilimnicola ehrlichii]|uniref:Small-conductance mechanosensitive channel n=1 Tax=Alkalilimnicola ehrlichii TaxID=351052 RepID=A0A3E0X3M7_9GAMM|nr:mechanosensitive ion channel family protein [Alkalilimnicola ehrlichii]RFA31414.1 mechanosensitive ion channel protein [Alkalilimnicola ehrlichii]RFA39314.1 mechanosensitive ion channel protein [Alkalilimnicola ehrlichii]